jgi:hypothetical protein
MKAIEDVHYRAGSGSSCNFGHHYLPSPSGLYFGMVEHDGKFVVYRGASPEDKHDVLWSTSVSNPAVVQGARDIMLSFGHKEYVASPVYARVVAQKDSRFYDLWTSGKVDIGKTDTIKAVVEDDGSLCLYGLGEGEPSSAAKVLWKSDKTDPVVEYIVERIDYDIPHAKIGARTDSSILEQILHNNSPVKDQTMHMSKKTSTTVISSWSNSTGFKATLGGKVTAGVPGVSSAEANWSFEASNTYTLGESTSSALEITFTFDLVVPPNATYRAWAQIKEAEFELPYTVFGELHFKSGKKIRHKLSGTYQGKNGYVGFYQVDDITKGREKAGVFRGEGPAKIHGLT